MEIVWPLKEKEREIPYEKRINAPISVNWDIIYLGTRSWEWGILGPLQPSDAIRL